MRLTKKQALLMADLLSEPEGTTMECARSERRTAEALSRKGFLKILPGESPLGYFEVFAIVQTSPPPHQRAE